MTSSFTRQIAIQTGARLHFGLIRVGKASVPSAQQRYGGLGVMIEQPALCLIAKPASDWSCPGPFGERVLSFAKSFYARTALRDALPTAIAFELPSAPPAHSGLGSGTQLTLATAAAIYALAGTPLPAARQFALETGRGRRSAIGCHGFYHGGLLFEGGKEESEPLSELQCRVDLPSDWRFVLIRPTNLEGTAGPTEGKLFEQAPTESNSHAETMIHLAKDILIPAAFEADFLRFSEALFEYGCLAGESFAFAQGDIFSHPQTRQRVEDLRSQGIRGVGQSSWGPTIFALLSNPTEAENLAKTLRQDAHYTDCKIWTTAARNQAAQITTT